MEPAEAIQKELVALSNYVWYLPVSLREKIKQ